MCLGRCFSRAVCNGIFISYLLCLGRFLTECLEDWQRLESCRPPLRMGPSHLFEELGMAQYLTSSECARGSGLYVDSMSGGSNIGFNTNQSTYSQCKTLMCTFGKDIMKSQ